MNTPPPIVSRVCTTLLGTTALSTERLKAGPRTAVYRVRISNGRTVIVKLCAHTARRNAITEATAIRSVTGTVPVPRPAGAGSNSGHLGWRTLSPPAFLVDGVIGRGDQGSEQGIAGTFKVFPRR
jgi:hypothetical protein